jgi:hypothetical protein
MEAICSSETSVETQRTTARHIPEDDSLYKNNVQKLFYSLNYVLEKSEAWNHPIYWLHLRFNSHNSNPYRCSMPSIKRKRNYFPQKTRHINFPAFSVHHLTMLLSTASYAQTAVRQKINYMSWLAAYIISSSSFYN